MTGKKKAPGGQGPSNEQFLADLFNEKPNSNTLVTQFKGDPKSAPRGEWSPTAWTPGTVDWDPDANVYATVSTFTDKRRRKASFEALHVLMVDDVVVRKSKPHLGGKVDRSAVTLPPTWVTETSPNNAQFGYAISPPIQELHIARRLIERVAEAVSPGSDPGMLGVTRYFKLPVGVNGKPAADGWRNTSLHYKPERTYTAEEVCAGFGIDYNELLAGPKPLVYDAERYPDGGPVVEAIEWYSEQGGLKYETDERFELTCPWVDGHSEDRDDGCAVGKPGSHPELPGFYFKCHHGSCSDRALADFMQHCRDMGYGRTTPQEDFADYKEEEPLNLPQRSGAELRALKKPNEDNVSMVAAEQLADQLVYLHGTGRWHQWDGQRWLPDECEATQHLVRELVRWLNVENKVNVTKRSFVNSVMGYMRADPTFSRAAGAFDLDTWLLNTPKGTVDLRTGRLRRWDPADCITKITRVGPGGDGERFLQFMDEICGGDQSLVRFHQVSLGACLSGALEDHWLLFWVGEGRNGKNTLGDLVQWILGDYARSIPSDALMAKANAEHKTELTPLKGARLVTSSEVEDGARWAEAKINQVTGDEVITARYMRQDPIEFPRTHKHLIYGNHKPTLANVTVALTSRIKIVPFPVSFAGREEKGLNEALREEAGFVLSWLIEGHKAWLEDGLPECEAVAGESKQYLADQSTVSAWMDECLEMVEDDGRPRSEWPSAKQLYDNYVVWKRGRGEREVTMVRWSEAVQRRLEKVQTRHGNVYVGAVIPSDFGQI